MQDVLIIDDEIDVRDAIKRILDRAGYRSRTAANATEAIADMQHNATDIVITDIIMPKLNGVDAILSIRAQFPDVRIVAISGGGNFGLSSYKPDAITTTAYLAAAEKAGADLTLTKPFEARDLVQALQSVARAEHG